MNKRNIIIICLIILVSIVIFFVFGKKDAKVNLSNKQNQTNTEYVLEEAEAIQKELEEALQNCRENYKKYGSKNFSVYFSVGFIEEYFSRGTIRLINDLESVEGDELKIYSPTGEDVKEIPNSVNFEKNINKIEAGKTYIIKIYSGVASNAYYYTLRINNLGASAVELICYTVGEQLEDERIVGGEEAD